MIQQKSAQHISRDQYSANLTSPSRYRNNFQQFWKFNSSEEYNWKNQSYRIKFFPNLMIFRRMKHRKCIPHELYPLNKNRYTAKNPLTLWSTELQKHYYLNAKPETRREPQCKAVLSQPHFHIFLTVQNSIVQKTMNPKLNTYHM
jgi:hypothetical protein